jgi:hypothetical protein
MATRVTDAGVRAVATALTVAQAAGAPGALGAPGAPGALGLAVRGGRAATVAVVAAGVPEALGAPGVPGALGALGLAVRGGRAATVAVVAAGAPGALGAPAALEPTGALKPARSPGATRALAAGPVAARAARQAVARLAASGPGIAAGRRVAAAMGHGAAPTGEKTRAQTDGVPDRVVVRAGGATGVPTTEATMPAPAVRPGGRRAGLGADRRTGLHAPPAKMKPTALLGIAASARIVGRHRGTAAHETVAIAAPAAARAGTGDQKTDAVINAGQVGSVPAGHPTAVTLIAVADREPGSAIAGPVDTGRIGPGGTVLAGTCPNGSAAPSQTSGRTGAAAPLEVPGRSAATTGATVVRVTVTVGTATGTWLRAAVTGLRSVRGVRVAQGRARRSQERQAGAAGRGGRGARGARAGRQGSVPVRAQAATATARTDAGATVAGATVVGPHRPRRASRIALPRTRFLAR